MVQRTRPQMARPNNPRERHRRRPRRRERVGADAAARRLIWMSRLQRHAPQQKQQRRRWRKHEVTPGQKGNEEHAWCARLRNYPAKTWKGLRC